MVLFQVRNYHTPPGVIPQTAPALRRQQLVGPLSSHRRDDPTAGVLPAIQQSQAVLSACRASDKPLLAEGHSFGPGGWLLLRVKLLKGCLIPG